MSLRFRNINKLDIYKQFSLPLKFKTIKNRENFLVYKSNLEAFELIDNYRFWQSRKRTNSIPGAIIYGPKVQEKLI